MPATDRSRALRRVFLIVLCLKLYVFGLLYLQFHRTNLASDYTAFVFVPEGSKRSEQLAQAETSFFTRLTPFDGQLYLDIAVKGYRARKDHRGPEADAREGKHAFFPLFPALLRGLRFVLGDIVPAALTMDLLLSSLALVFVWKFARDMGISAWTTCGLMLAFPSALFQYVLYTESLFLFLSVSYWLLLQRRAWVLAALVGYLGGLCRPQGVLLIFLATELILPRRGESSPRYSLRASAIASLVAIAPILGLGTVMLINLQVTGSPWSFLEVQNNWGRHVEFDSLLDSARELLNTEGALLDLGGTVFGLTLLPFVWKRLPLPLALYATASMVMPLATGRVLSMGRFVSVSFPHFLALAAVLEDHRRVAWGIVGFFALFQLLLSKPLMAWHFVG